jgi:hypothetical protein
MHQDQTIINVFFVKLTYAASVALILVHAHGATYPMVMLLLIVHASRALIHIAGTVKLITCIARIVMQVTVSTDLLIRHMAYASIVSMENAYNAQTLIKIDAQSV